MEVSFSPFSVRPPALSQDIRKWVRDPDQDGKRDALDNCEGQGHIAGLRHPHTHTHICTCTPIDADMDLPHVDTCVGIHIVVGRGSHR